MKTKKRGTAIDIFKLYYEELENKIMNKSKPTRTEIEPGRKKINPLTELRHIDVKQFMLSRSNVVKTAFKDVVNKVKRPRKINKKLTKLDRENAKKQRKDAILGIGLLLVVVSIIYSTYVVRIFVNSSASLVALAPQVLFALFTIIKAFSKIYK